MPDARRPHLLYVAWGFPPSRSGGVYRALATANAFARAGWTVSVLTVERNDLDRYTGIDASLEDRIEEGVRIVRLPFSWPQRDTDIRRFSRLRVFAPDTWRRLDRWRDLARFPEPTYGRWRPTLERAALRVHRENPVDLVIASANPNVDFMVAWVLHRRHRVAYVLDYRDAWLLDVFGGGMLHPENGRAAHLERRLVEHAREAWFVNEPIRAWHQARYPAAAARMHVVANGFDPELIPPPRARTADQEHGVTLGYLGTLSTRVPLAELIAGWRWARDHDELAARSRILIHGYLGYYATPQADLRSLIDSATDAGLQYAGPVPKGGVATVYASFDVLLLAIGAGRYVTSGKVFEYMATGLPIVSVHDAGNAATEVLRGYSLWFPVADLTAEAVGQALVRASHAACDADEATRAAARAYAAGFARERQLRPRVDTLSSGAWSTAAAPVRAPATLPARGAARAPGIESSPTERRDRLRVAPPAASASTRRVIALAARTPMSMERQDDLVRALRSASGCDVALELWSWAPVEPASRTAQVSERPVSTRVLGPSIQWNSPVDPAPASGAAAPTLSQSAISIRTPLTRGLARMTHVMAGATRRARRSRQWSASRRLVRGGVDRHFARQVMRNSDLLAAASRCDLVVALDPAAALAAWQIARRVVRPDVVLGLPAAERALQAQAAAHGPVMRPTPSDRD